MNGKLIFFGLSAILIALVIMSFVSAAPQTNNYTLETISCPKLTAGANDGIYMYIKILGVPPSHVERVTLHEYGHYLYDQNYPGTVGSKESEYYAELYEQTHYIAEVK